jgi:hypothetical protein
MKLVCWYATAFYSVFDAVNSSEPHISCSDPPWVGYSKVMSTDLKHSSTQKMDAEGSSCHIPENHNWVEVNYFFLSSYFVLASDMTSGATTLCGYTKILKGIICQFQKQQCFRRHNLHTLGNKQESWISCVIKTLNGRSGRVKGTDTQITNKLA